MFITYWGNCIVTHKSERQRGLQMSPGACLVMYSNLSVSEFVLYQHFPVNCISHGCFSPLRPDLLALVDLSEPLYAIKNHL